MAKAPKDQKKAVSEIEVEPGAWERFRRAIRVAVKAGPQHRKAKIKTKTKRMTTTVVALLVLVGAPLSAHCATWLRCVPATEFKVDGSDSGAKRVWPMDGNAQAFTVVIIGAAVAGYDEPTRAIHPLYDATVEPNKIVLSQEGLLDSHIDRQTGDYRLIVHELRDPTWVWSVVNGTCTAIRPQSIAPNKF
jgi:hypothetical protein